ncbi:MAG TPA: hypothetical protein VHF25_11975 [Nitriliruptorales bacterium]|nr:hypothetical protein [Nitriliruptorales bacterium]
MNARVGRSVAGLALAVLLAAACGDPEETEVLGVQIERTETQTADDVSPTPTSVTTAPATPATPTTAATSEPEAPPAPEPASPQPEPAPPPEAQMLPAGPGWSFGTWTPVSQQEQADPATCCWTDTSSTPTIERGEQPPPRLFTDVRDAEAYPDGRPGFQQPSRLAACDSWIEAAPDRPVRVHGRVTVEMLYGDAATPTVHDVDQLLAPGQRFDLPRGPAQRVEAARGVQVTCRTSFEQA